MPFDLTKLHPSAQPTDFYNGKLLPPELIQEIENKLSAETIDARYSKKYLTSLNINIPANRAGVIRMKNLSTGHYELYAIYKKKKLGDGGYGKIKLIQLVSGAPLTSSVEFFNSFKVIKVFTLPCTEKTFAPEVKNFAKEAEFNEIFGTGDKRILPKKIDKDNYDGTKICVIQNFIKGKELHTCLWKSLLTTNDKFEIMLQAFEVVQQFHDKGYIHRDIKVENFMYDAESKKLTLLDFGMTEKIDEPDGRLSCGTAGSLAPEIFLGASFSVATDVYSMGRMFQDVFSIRDKVTWPNSKGGNDIVEFGNIDNNGVETSSRLRVGLLFLAQDLLAPLPHRITLKDAHAKLQSIYSAHLSSLYRPPLRQGFFSCLKRKSHCPTPVLLESPRASNSR